MGIVTMTGFDVRQGTYSAMRAFVVYEPSRPSPSKFNQYQAAMLAALVGVKE